MTPLQVVKELSASFGKEVGHERAAALAFQLAGLVPELLERIERFTQRVEQLEQSVQQNVRHIVCKCETCGIEFKLFKSELRPGKRSGRFCTMKCLREAQRGPIKEETA